MPIYYIADSFDEYDTLSHYNETVVTHVRRSGLVIASGPEYDDSVRAFHAQFHDGNRNSAIHPDSLEVRADIGTTGETTCLRLTGDARVDVAAAVELSHANADGTPCDDRSCSIAFAMRNEFWFSAAHELRSATETPLLDEVCAIYAEEVGSPSASDAREYHAAALRHSIPCGACGACYYADGESPRDAERCANCHAPLRPVIFTHKANGEVGFRTPFHAFVGAYLECALWSSTGAGEDCDEPFDQDHGIDDFTDAALRIAWSECADFFFGDETADLLDKAKEMQPEYDEAHAGHDFWLTRNGHGAGFWDRGLGAVGDKLTQLSKSYGSCDLYVTDDGKVGMQ